MERGHRREQQGHCCRKPWRGGGVSNGALGWEKGVSLQCEAREAGAESPLRHTARDEGTGRAGTLGEESLGLPYLPSSRDWCVPQ